MNNSSGNNTRNSILNAINNLIDSNQKDNPYDKTFIGRIKTVKGNNLYDIIINGKTYQNIKGLPFFNYNVNSVVYCLAPQGNMNQLRIILDLDKKVNLNCDNINTKEIVMGNTSIEDINGLLEISNSQGVNINNNSVETIIDKSLTANGYIKYSSGLIIQWGSASIAQDIRAGQIYLNTSFTTTDYSIILQLGTPSTINQYMNGSGINSKTISYFVYSTECYANNMNWIAIGY